MQTSPQERLLACYQQALGHDLPNKLVALQGIARLLEEELAEDMLVVEEEVDLVDGPERDLPGDFDEEL